MQKFCQPSIPYLVMLSSRDENGKGSEMNPAAIPLKIRWRRFTRQKVNDIRINLSHHQGGKDGKSRNMTTNCPASIW